MRIFTHAAILALACVARAWAAADAAASIAAANPVLTVSKNGSGSGTVANNGPEIACGATCSSPFPLSTPVTLTAVPAPGSRFTGWLGPCTGTGDCTFAIGADTTVFATFARASIGSPRLDADGTFGCDAASDGLLAVRHLSGVTGAALTTDALGPGALRSTPAAVFSYLTDITPILDIDGNGHADALTDGLLLTRYLLGLRGDALIAGAIGSGATRASAMAIEQRIETLCTIAIFVAKTGNDASPGTKQLPKLTINAGVAAAVASGAAFVVVGAGQYVESPAVQLAADVAVVGGYDPSSWTPGGGTTSIIGGPAPVPGESQLMSVLAKNLAAPASLQDVTVIGPSATSGTGTYAIVSIGTTLDLLRVNVIAGNAATGTTGAPGINASPLAATAGMKGGDGLPAAEFTTSCDATSRGLGGPGGTNSPAGTSGGAGGAGGTMDTLCTGNPLTSDFTATAGLKGADAVTSSSPDFGIGGAGAPANMAVPGADGKPGLVIDGTAGTGGSGLQVVGSYVVAKAGGTGGNGAPGGGGGGGGGSGGNDSGTDSYGAGGGGGGAGGAPGTGGAGGGGGGLSVGVYAASATVSMNESSIVRGHAGDGGTGGAGGQGQAGGPGGAAGLAVGDSFAGGQGGAGGHGGHGGGGGGGAGGASVGILLHNAASQIGFILYSGGASGTGGTGGPSPPGGNNGNAGTAGQLGTVVSF